MSVIETMVAQATAGAAPTFVLTADEAKMAGSALSISGKASKAARDFGLAVFKRTNGLVAFWDSSSDAYAAFNAAVTALAPKDHTNVRMVTKSARDAAKEAYDIATKPALNAARIKAEQADETFAKAKEKLDQLKAEKAATADPVQKARLGVHIAKAEKVRDTAKADAKEAVAAFTLAKAEANPKPAKAIDYPAMVAEGVAMIHEGMAHIPDDSFNKVMHRAIDDLIRAALACEWIKSN
jgi:hypothetical protein